MKYLLVVLTHGDPQATLPRAIGSFAEHVTVPPTRALLHCDGSDPFAAWDFVRYSPWDWTWEASPVQNGFCRSCERSWEIACLAFDVDYVFWLEHDFLFTRTVDLENMARLLDENQQLAQVTLMRDAVNDTELAAGGLFESRRGEYELRQSHGHPWLEHSSYFSTNPMLMRREFIRFNPWTNEPRECEGRFGIGLVAKGYTFGVWGAGEPWVSHVGVRTGSGY